MLIASRIKKGNPSMLDRDLALELLPAPDRLERAREDAEISYRQASSKKALASARDLLDEARRNGSDAAEAGAYLAQAHLWMGIALRRGGDRTLAQKEYLACHEALALLLESKDDSIRKKAAKIQVDLYLEEAIALFIEGDWVESARKNERAAKLAAAISKSESACRAWLNAAVSWDRAHELREAKACLSKGQSLLPKLGVSTLETSYLLFAWKMAIDHGPLSKPSELPSQSTLSQKSLYLLYSWEHALITRSMSDAEAARSKLLNHLNEIQEKQFESEINELAAFSDHLHLGRRKSSSAQKNPNQSLLHVAAELSEFFIKGAWKRLEAHSSYAIRSAHPGTQAWGYRAQAWTLAKQKNFDEAKASLKKAQEIALSQEMEQLVYCLSLELGIAESDSARLSIQEKRIFSKWTTLVPSRQHQLLVYTLTDRCSATPEAAASLIDEALRGAGPYAQSLVIDGARQLIRLPQKNKSVAAEMIQIEKLPVQKKLLFALIAAYPNAVSKEDLVSRVWDELYNPLIHDAVLYRTASRLRKLLGSGWIAFESGALRLTPGTRNFLAALPSDEALLRQSPLDERKIRILTLLKYKGRVTRSEAVKALQAPERTVARDLSFLIDQKLAVRQGAGRATVYVPAV
jgi:hypothetical protein